MRRFRLDLRDGETSGIAFGDPAHRFAWTIVLSLALELRRRGGGTGAAALCGGGGQGDALILRVRGE